MLFSSPIRYLDNLLDEINRKCVELSWLDIDISLFAFQTACTSMWSSHLSSSLDADLILVCKMPRHHARNFAT